MVQVLKPEVKENISQAALRVFARQGFLNTKMTDIARESDVSTGNIYRYFKNKEDLFYELVTVEFIDEMKKMLVQRIEAFKGISDLSELESDSPYLVIVREQLELCIDNRLMLIILFEKSKGTKYEHFFDEIVELMEQLAIEYFRSMKGEFVLSAEQRFTLHLIYTNYVRGLVEILIKYGDRAEIREIMTGYLHYHLAGLKQFMM